jgi:hypothetical protein
MAALFALSHRQPHHKLYTALRLLWCWYVDYRCVCWQQQDQEEGAGHFFIASFTRSINICIASAGVSCLKPLDISNSPPVTVVFILIDAHQLP